ncbi:MAG TPA: RMD1 family protein [Pseudomonadota bacterium]|nr:RMD1 family protein [Pseudomonadota bacterium]
MIQPGRWPALGSRSYEEDVQEILSRSEAITRSLQIAGRLPGRVGDLVKFIGSCIATKNGVIATLALFDKPDAAWEVQSLDRLYSSLRLELELDDRFRALEAKLRMIQENLVLLVDLSQHRSTWRLEVTVVLLILFEVLLTLWQMFRGTPHA